MRIKAMAIAAALVAALPLQAGAQDAPLDWMVGDWRTEAAGEWTAEHWAPAADGAMTGTSASGRDRTVRSRESMRIRFRDGKAVYTASPDGAPPTDFTELSRGPSEIVFANDAHDYPQRIRYWREGDRLMAEISAKDGSRAMRWNYRRTRP